VLLGPVQGQGRQQDLPVNPGRLDRRTGPALRRRAFFLARGTRGRPSGIIRVSLEDPTMTPAVPRPILLATVLTLAVTTACGGNAPATAAPETAAPPATSALVPIPNARIPIEGVLSGGQPTPEQIEAAARAGFRTVINIRTAEEPGFEWEKDAVEKLGMTYVHIPVGGEESFTRETITAIDAALDDAMARGPVLYHCASGNRIGATLALRAAWIDGAPSQDAWYYGLATGMTRTAEMTRRLLGLPPEPRSR
jgi:uncharacterized protein (TIGR01244 family)